MKVSLNIGQYRSKRLESLAKDIPVEKLPYNAENGKAGRLVLRNSMKLSVNSNTLNRKLHLPPTLNNGQSGDSTSQRSTGFKHLRSQSDQYNPESSFYQRPSIMSPTTSSLRKLVQLQGPAKAFVRDLQNGPGPGSYHKELNIGGASYAVGKARRVRERKTNSVGPGAYEAQMLSVGIGYSMTPRRKTEKKIVEVPGPGSYSPTFVDSSIKFSVSKADRNKRKLNESPGPGAYAISRPSSSRSALTVKSHRPPLSQIIDTPGPGAYHYELKIGGPELSLRRKFDFKSKSIDPGPGSYTPSTLSQTSPSWRFGSSKKRLEFNDYTVPEPGWYNTRNSFRH